LKKKSIARPNAKMGLERQSKLWVVGAPSPGEVRTTTKEQAVRKKQKFVQGGQTDRNPQVKEAGKPFEGDW